MTDSDDKCAAAPLNECRATEGLLDRLLSWMAPTAADGGKGALPSSLAQLQQRCLVNGKWFGIIILRCDQSLDTASAVNDLYDHPWSFLRIRLTGRATEPYLDGSMAISNRSVRRLQFVHANDFLGRAVSSKRAWVVIIRAAARKRAGKLSGFRDGQAAYVEEVPWGRAAPGHSSQIVVDE